MDIKLSATQEQIVSEIKQRTPFIKCIGTDEFYSQFALAILGNSAYRTCYGAYVRNNTLEQDYLVWRPDEIADSNIATSVLFHELAHATAVYLSNRHMFASMESLTYAREEITAEYAAQLLMQYFRLSTQATDNRSVRYIEHYSVKLPTSEIHIAKAQANEAFQYILSNWLPDFNEEFIMKGAA